MTAESAQPGKASNVTRPFLWVGSGDETRLQSGAIFHSPTHSCIDLNNGTNIVYTQYRPESMEPKSGQST